MVGETAVLYAEVADVIAEALKPGADVEALAARVMAPGYRQVIRTLLA